MGARQRLLKLTPYLLLAPGILWLLVFYVYPAIQMFISSFWTGTLETGFTFSLSNWTTYADALTRYQSQFLRSLIYGAAATVICFIIAYPLAYGIAFRGGRFKNVLLFLVIAPFFTSFLIRTISWKILLGNDGPALAILRDALGIVPENFNILSTPLAVVSGLTYQFLPFMVLPLYVALEKVDFRLVEAARDLYAGPWRRGGAITGGVGGGLLAACLMIGLRYAGFDAESLLPLALATAIGAGVGAVIGSFLISESFVRIVWPLSLPGV